MLKKLAITTLAASSLMMAANASAMNGIYVNGNLGYVAQDGKSKLENAWDADASAQVDLTDRSRKVFGYGALLGYNFDMDDQWSLGAEFGYGDYGQMKWEEDGGANNEVKVDQTAWLLLARANMHFDDMLSAYVKAGAAFGKTEFKAKNGVTIDGEDSKDYNNTRMMAVLGASYNVMPELAVNLEWQHIFGTDVTTNSANKFQTVNAIMAGLTYTFEL